MDTEQLLIWPWSVKVFFSSSSKFFAKVLFLFKSSSINSWWSTFCQLHLKMREHFRGVAVSNFLFSKFRTFQFGLLIDLVSILGMESRRSTSFNSIQWGSQTVRCRPDPGKSVNNHFTSWNSSLQGQTCFLFPCIFFFSKVHRLVYRRESWWPWPYSEEHAKGRSRIHSGQLPEVDLGLVHRR